MPVEFALRPRLHLREKAASSPRARARLPKFALPALAYWLVIGGLVYEFVHHHEPSASLPEAEAALTSLNAAPPPTPTVRAWWRPLPPPLVPRATPSSEPEAPALEAPALEAPAAVAALEAPALEAPALEAPAAVAALEASIPQSEFEPELKPRRGEAPLAVRPGSVKHAPVASHSRDAVSVELPVTARLPRTEPAPLAAPVPASAPALPASPSATSSLPSCEAAVASANQDVDFSGGNRAADLPTQAIAAVLENGAWLSGCAVPERTALDVCVAIQGGRVVGASVSSRPSDPALDQCLKRRASSLRFPYSPHLDLARTRF